MDFTTWVANARAVSIESEITRRHITLKRSGSERIGPCPKCGGRDRFSINVAEGVWNCRGCKPDSVSGDIIGLVEWLDDCDFITACEELTHEPRPNGMHEPKGNGKTLDDKESGVQGKDRLGPIIQTYDYTDETGVLLFQVTRHAIPEKTFRQRRPDGFGGWVNDTKGVSMVPYRLPEVIEAIAFDRVIFIPEGEKDVDNIIALGAPATCNPRGAGKWGNCNIDGFFSGADVVIIADNDAQTKNKKTGELLFHPDGRPRFAGWDHAHDVAAHLAVVAANIRVLDLKKIWPGCPDKGDISDWIAGGGTLNQLYTHIDEVPTWQPTDAQHLPEIARPRIPLVFPFPIEADKIPRRQWVVPGLLLRRNISVLVAPPGIGKSLLTLQIGMAATAGKVWAKWHPRRRPRVMFINSEDDEDEMRRRLLAAQGVMGLNASDLGGLAFAEQPDTIVIAKADYRTKTVVRTPMVEAIVSTVIANAFDILIVDPFAETFEGDENSNSELKWAAVLWREIARKTNSAVLLVHHTKKYGAEAGSMESSRGGSALTGVARVVSTLFSMTDQEAEAMGIPDDDRTRFLRFDDAKANLTLVTFAARWFEKKTITLDNASDDEPADEVGVLVPWQAPNVLDLIDVPTANRILDALDIGMLDDQGAPTGDPFCIKNTGDTPRWAGRVVQKYVPDCSDKNASKILKTWLKHGVIEEYQAVLSNSNRSPRNCIRVTGQARPGAMTEG